MVVRGVSLLEEDLADCLEAFIYPSYEARGIINFNDPPGPDTVYIHDTTVKDTFFRRVEPSPELYARGVELIRKVRGE